MKPRRATQAVTRSGRGPKPRLLTVATAPGLVGRDRYVVRRIKGHLYLYLRQYEGAEGHATPRYRDRYLGAVPERLVRRGQGAALLRWARAKRGRWVRGL